VPWLLRGSAVPRCSRWASVLACARRRAKRGGEGIGHRNASLYSLHRRDSWDGGHAFTPRRYRLVACRCTARRHDVVVQRESSELECSQSEKTGERDNPSH
jgi:hypothetical protein